MSGELPDAVCVEVIPGVIIRPGDILVLQTTEPLTAQHAASVRDIVRERLPGLADVVVLGGVVVGGVYRDEATADEGDEGQR